MTIEELYKFLEMIRIRYNDDFGSIRIIIYEDNSVKIESYRDDGSIILTDLDKLYSKYSQR